jgi:hypothetical protein
MHTHPSLFPADITPGSSRNSSFSFACGPPNGTCSLLSSNVYRVSTMILILCAGWLQMRPLRHTQPSRLSTQSWRRNRNPRHLEGLRTTIFLKSCVLPPCMAAEISHRPYSFVGLASVLFANTNIMKKKLYILSAVDDRKRHTSHNTDTSRSRLPKPGCNAEICSRMKNDSPTYCLTRCNKNLFVD